MATILDDYAETMQATQAAETPPLDPERIERFGGAMVDIINHGMLALMVGIGHQVGLFEALAELPPSDAAMIARTAGCDERYVREWLGAMVTGRVVEYDPIAATYWLPPEHASFLTRAAGPNDLSGIAQYVGAFGAIEQQVVRCFREGGGVPYAAVPRFQHLMAEETKPVIGATLLQQTLPAVPNLVERLTEGIRVLEIGCGYGIPTITMAQAFPRSTFVAIDISQEGVDHGSARATALDLQNVRFAVEDAHTLDAVEVYDLVVTFDVIHDLRKPALVLAAIHRALKPGGLFLMVDIAASSHLHENLGHPLAPALYAISTMHCMTVSLSQGGDGLGAVWGEQTAVRMLGEAGFRDIIVSRHEGDMLNNYYTAWK